MAMQCDDDRARKEVETLASHVPCVGRRESSKIFFVSRVRHFTPRRYDHRHLTVSQTEPHDNIDNSQESNNECKTISATTNRLSVDYDNFAVSSRRARSCLYDANSAIKPTLSKQAITIASYGRHGTPRHFTTIDTTLGGNIIVAG